jgi:hypothetical protein
LHGKTPPQHPRASTVAGSPSRQCERV